MAWNDLTFVDCSILTAQKMTRLQANFVALAAGEPGAPPITRVGALDQVTLTTASSGTPAANTLYKAPTGVGFAVPLDPASSTATLQGVLTAAQGALPAGAVETWHVVGTAGEPTYGTGWGPCSAGNLDAAFIKLPSGTVVVRGLLTFTGTWAYGSTIFTLPIGYRPGNTFRCLGQYNYTGVGRIIIGNDGAVHTYDMAATLIELHCWFMFMAGG